MDDVRALLAVLPEAPLPSEAEVEHADGLIIVFPQDESEYSAASERVSEAIELGPPVYVVIPPLDSGLARKYLQSTLQPGVYGVAVQTAASVDQLRYLEGVLEELEIRADIRPGLDRDGGRIPRPARDQHHVRLPLGDARLGRSDDLDRL